MLLEQLLPLPPDIAITAVETEQESVTVTIETHARSAPCPECAVPATRIHSWYTRTLADLPCAGQRVLLRLHTRKWHCDTSLCPRRIFTERLALLTRPYARMTVRLNAIIASIGVTITGRGGSRFAGQLGIVTSPTTINRRIMALPDSPAPPLAAIGLDDWSFRRGRRFGAVIVDLDRHRVVDLLPDRTAPTAVAWLQRHPEIQVVSRDRSQEFATAIAEGAPQALQVCDRFHLLKNLGEMVESIVVTSYHQLRHAASDHPQQSISPPQSTPSTPDDIVWMPVPPPQREQLRLARQQLRTTHYAHLLQLQAQGYTSEEIASQMGMKPRTVRYWFAHFQADTRRRKRQSIFDPFAAYVAQRWTDGEHNGTRLWNEIVAQGFTGSLHLVHAYLRRLRHPHLSQAEEPAEQPAAVLVTALSPEDRSRLATYTVTQVRWMLMRDPTALTEAERMHLSWLGSLHPTLATTALLVQDFRAIVQRREGQRLEAWTTQCHESRITGLIAFAKGLRRDWEAVVAGLTQRASNGQTEGQVNKLKVIKRMMYGRANFPLLRKHVLYAT